jgi:hypothetical protein
VSEGSYAGLRFFQASRLNVDTESRHTECSRAASAERLD